MYCPQCGQQQASADMRFCSRCGFPLSHVSELLTSGGVLSQRGGGIMHTAQDVSPRRKGVTQGVMMMMMGAVVVPILAILGNYSNSSRGAELMVGLSAVIFFVGGLLRILFAAFFEPGAKSMKGETAEQTPQAPAQFASHARPSALPPPRATPVPSFAPRRVNTAELVTPPSVTENTTKLLDEDKR